MAFKCWKNQTSKIQKKMGSIQYIHKDETQVSVSRWDFDVRPRNWQFNAFSVREARKGYPNNEIGITKKEALKRLNKYMKEHDSC